MSYLKNVALGLDMFASAVTGGNPGDTISLRAAVARQEGKRWGCILCKVLNLFQSDHCGKTLAADDHQRLLWGEAVERGQHPL